MTNSKLKFNQLIFYFFALLIVFLPVQRLIEQILLFRFHFPENLAFWTTHFYEPLIIIVLLINFILLIKNRKIKSRTNWISIIVLLLIVLSIFSALLISPSLSRGIEGFRFSIFFVLVFLAAYFSSLDLKQSNKLINLYLIMAIIISLWAIIERFLPVNYLMKLQLIDPNSCFGYGTHRVGTIWQSVTGIGGPNQLGSYLIPAIFIAISHISPVSADGSVWARPSRDRSVWARPSRDRSVWARPSRDRQAEVGNLKPQIYNSKLKMYLSILIIFGITAVILSFSRSAWVGLYVGLLASAVILIKNFWLKTISIVILLALVGGIGYYYLNKPNDILTHGTSNVSHQTAFQSSMSEIKNRMADPIKLFFGSGIGTAGPAVLKYGDGFMSESWYLQLVLELGILGVIFWLTLIVFLLINLYQKNQGLFLGLVAVSIAAIFLHTFADNPAMSISLFLLIGLISPHTSDKLKQ